MVDVSKIVVGAWLHNDSALAPRLKGRGLGPGGHHGNPQSKTRAQGAAS